MKHIIISALSIFILFSSCTKQLNQQPISVETTDAFYKSSNDFLQAVNAVYSSLRTYPDRQLNLSETRSDNLYALSPGGVRDWEGINSFFSTIATNPYVAEAYLTNFNGIYKANTVLDQLKKNGTVISDATLRNRFEAETRYLRAFMYFDLVRWFGKVPLVDHPLTVAEANTIGRSSVSTIYDLIISDLQFAAANLPASYSATDKGRATRYAATATLALVYMTRSGPTYGIEGPGLGLNEWSKASALLDTIINANVYSLLPSYSSIFSYTNENNAEVIFDVEYISGNNNLGGSFPWVLVPDFYFNSVGIVSQGGYEIRPLSNNLIQSFDTTNDLRYKFSVQRGYTYNGTTETQSFFKKYLDITKYGTNRFDWPINFIVTRYTDILMLKAECILHGSGAGDVDGIVNQVRTRAGLPNISGVTLPVLLEERRREFMAEGLRWHDLVRSGNVVSIMQAWIAADDVQKRIQPFQTNYIIYPIPQSEMDVKPGLYTQNPGY
ncbi:MAG: RagB/SusD family nutrient uptake outer membrane protein [Flavipsychrobacter sp.]|nr:RagB/SusD family nutrient uptake outer membrane protein [Flavipsychrobacter sp.]